MDIIALAVVVVLMAIALRRVGRDTVADHHEILQAIAEATERARSEVSPPRQRGSRARPGDGRHVGSGRVARGERA